MGKQPNPLEDVRPHLCNPVSCQIVPAEVSVVNSIEIGEKIEREYIASLPNEFYNFISSPIDNVCSQKQIKGNGVRPVTDLESIFLRLFGGKIGLSMSLLISCVQCLLTY